MNITLAPIPFYWSKNAVFEFYQQIKTLPVNRVCLGETICSKRRELRFDDWLEIGNMLAASGKDVVMSTLALLEAESEMRYMQRVCSQSDFGIEANDLAAVEALHALGKSIIGGPFLNIYNAHTLKLLVKDGLTHWSLPVELGRADLEEMLNQIKQQNINVKTELMVHGYLPLALSARCFTARALGRQKDDCKRICIDYPTGFEVDSQEDQRLFNINGIQTLSGKVLDLLDQMPEIRALNLDSIRICPSQYDMSEIIRAYDQAVQGSQHPSKPSIDAGICNGYWYGKEGMSHYSVPTQAI